MEVYKWLTWSVEDVCDWAQRMNYSTDVVEAFLRHGVDGPTLAEISEQDLEGIIADDIARKEIATHACYFRLQRAKYGFLIQHPNVARDAGISKNLTPISPKHVDKPEKEVTPNTLTSLNGEVVELEGQLRTQETVKEALERDLMLREDTNSRLRNVFDRTLSDELKTVNLRHDKEMDFMAEKVAHECDENDRLREIIGTQQSAIVQLEAQRDEAYSMVEALRRHHALKQHSQAAPPIANVPSNQQGFAPSTHSPGVRPTLAPTQTFSPAVSSSQPLLGRQGYQPSQTHSRELDHSLQGSHRSFVHQAAAHTRSAHPSAQTSHLSAHAQDSSLSHTQASHSSLAHTQGFEPSLAHTQDCSPSLQASHRTIVGPDAAQTQAQASTSPLGHTHSPLGHTQASYHTQASPSSLGNTHSSLCQTQASPSSLGHTHSSLGHTQPSPSSPGRTQDLAPSFTHTRGFESSAAHIHGSPGSGVHSLGFDPAVHAEGFVPSAVHARGFEPLVSSNRSNTHTQNIDPSLRLQPRRERTLP